MPDTSLIIGLIVSIVFALVGGHLAITKIFPNIKDILSSATKETKVVNSIMLILIIYVGVFVLKKIIELVTALNIQQLNLIKLVDPAIEILISIEPTVRWIIIAGVIGLALKK